MQVSRETANDSTSLDQKLTDQILPRLRKKVTSALHDFHMLEEGDKVLVAVSGGKDSSILLLLLREIQKKAPFAFTVEPVIVDQKQPGFQVAAYRSWVKEHLDLDLKILEEDTYSIVKEKTQPGKSYCGLCSRLRRGILYNYASQHGFTKIALGHHRDDMNETLLLNMFFNGQLASMPPKLLSDDGRNVLIRPLAYCKEADIAQVAQDLAIPVIPCRLCGSQDNMQRQEVKNLLASLEQRFPRLNDSLFAAQGNIKLSQLSDYHLYDFKM